MRKRERENLFSWLRSQSRVKPSSDSRQGCCVAVVAALAVLEGGAVNGGLHARTSFWVSLQGAATDGLLSRPDPLCFLEAKAAAFEGASRDRVDCLGPGAEPHVLGAVCMVPEVAQVTSLGQVRSRCTALQPGRRVKDCQTFLYSFGSLKKKLAYLKISWKLRSSSDLQVKPVPPTLPLWFYRQKNIQGEKLWLCEATWEWALHFKKHPVRTKHLLEACLPCSCSLLLNTFFHFPSLVSPGP